MTLFKRAASKTLAVALSLALLLPSFGWAGGSGKEARLPIGATPLGAIRLPLGDADKLPPVRTAAVLDLTKALPAAPQRLEPHPVLQLLNALQAKGVSLPETVTTHADAAKLFAVAEALPEGRVRQNVLRLAHSVMAPGGSGSAGQAEALAKAFENSSLKGRPSDPKAFEVPAESLRWTPPADKLPASTRDLKFTDNQIVGQDSALKSIRSGLEMPWEGYNLYVSGPEGSGRESALRHILDQRAPKMETQPDLVAATNFADPSDPVFLKLPPGNGVKFKEAVVKFVRTYQLFLPEALNKGQAAAVKKALKERLDQAVEAREEAWEAAVAKVRIGRFGLKIVQVETENGTEPYALPAYDDNGVMKTIKSDEELEAKIKEGKFTRAEWQKAVKEAQKAAQPFKEAFEALKLRKAEEYANYGQALLRIDSQQAAKAVSMLGRDLVQLVSKSHDDTSAHKEWEKRAEELRAAFDAEAAKVRVGRYGVLIRVEDGGVVVSLTHEVGGKMAPLSPQDFQQMLRSGQITQADLAALQKSAQPLMEKFVELEKQIEDEHQAVHAKDPPPTQDEEAALDYVESLLTHAAVNYETFLPKKTGQGGETDEAVAALRGLKGPPAESYRVSVLRDNGGLKGARVVYEDKPTYDRVFGSAEGNNKVMLVPGIGAVRSETPGGPAFKPGSLHEADIWVAKLRDVLKEPGVYHALMEAAKSGQVEITEDGLQGLATMKGETYHVPHRPKIVLIGDPVLRMILNEHDADFANYFKSAAEFVPMLKINDQSIAGYLQFMKQVIVKAEGRLLDLSRDAISALLEFSARMVSSNQKLSAQFGQLDSLMREATVMARAAGRVQVTRADVDAALEARSQADGVYQEEFMQVLKDRIYVIETTGSKVGQMGGMTVIGGVFGAPFRQTSVASEGSPGVVSVDRQVNMSGPSFNKGVETVESFLRFALRTLLPNIRISDEQRYGHVDGDSSTSTSIYSSLSAISEVPIQQRFHVTGSADQFGGVLAIGGVNEKIEGYFDLVSYRGELNAENPPGVIVPLTNKSDLMLRADIAEAARRDEKTGKKPTFVVYHVSHVGQAMEILTGVPYGRILTLARLGAKKRTASNWLSRKFWASAQRLLKRYWRIPEPTK